MSVSLHEYNYLKQFWAELWSLMGFDTT